MKLKQFALLLASMATAVALFGCGGNASSSDPPPDLKVVAGDGTVTLTWTAAADVDYWLFYAPGSTVTTTNWLAQGGAAIQHATSPYTLGGLANGTTYSFTINGRKNGGAGGPGAPTQVAMPRFAGTNWVVGTPLGANTLTGVSVLSTSSVIVGSGGAIYTSIGGAAATVQTNPAAPADLNAIVYGGVGFVTVGATGTAVFSADAATWAAKSTGTVSDLYSITTPGNGAFAAVGAAGTIALSSDGLTWSLPTSGTTKNLYAATYGSAKYVAVGEGGTVLNSTDGSTWTAVTSGTTSNLRGVTFGAINTTTGTGSTAVTTTTNIFVAVGDAGTVITSNDGITWTVRTPISAARMNAVSFGGQFVAIGNGGVIYTSADGTAWTARSSGTTNDLFGIARTSTGYIAVGANGTNLTSF
ncbi:MAG: hypothetical protein ABI905_06860 [Betaproteobacteria bacterium]